jgi:hypothetical protein
VIACSRCFSWIGDECSSDVENGFLGNEKDYVRKALSNEHLECARANKNRKYVLAYRDKLAAHLIKHIIFFLSGKRLAKKGAWIV